MAYGAFHHLLKGIVREGDCFYIFPPSNPSKWIPPSKGECPVLPSPRPLGTRSLHPVLTHQFPTTMRAGDVTLLSAQIQRA